MPQRAQWHSSWWRHTPPPVALATVVCVLVELVSSIAFASMAAVMNQGLGVRAISRELSMTVSSVHSVLAGKKAKW